MALRVTPRCCHATGSFSRPQPRDNLAFHVTGMPTNTPGTENDPLGLCFEVTNWPDYHGRPNTEVNVCKNEHSRSRTPFNRRFSAQVFACISSSSDEGRREPQASCQFLRLEKLRFREEAQPHQTASGCRIHQHIHQHIHILMRNKNPPCNIYTWRLRAK